MNTEPPKAEGVETQGAIEDVCEGCGKAPAATFDSEGIPLCAGCADLPTAPVSDVNLIPLQDDPFREAVFEALELARFQSGSERQSGTFVEAALILWGAWKEKEPTYDR